LISRIVTLSVYKTVNEPIQQHTAVHYNSWLRWTAMNLRLQQTVIHSYSSKVQLLSEAKCNSPVVVAFCVHSVESVERHQGRRTI